MTLYARALFHVAMILFLAACSTLGKNMDPPKVTLDSLRSIPGEEGAPRFEIKLRVINPNAQALDIAGISYTVELLDRELVAGVTNDVPRIEPYSEEVVTLEAGLQVIELLRLLASLGHSGQGPLDYTFAAKIDFKGLVSTQRIEDSGEINLR